MKVSILTPIYGVEQFIAQCARSLMEQTYEDIEFIFVNDCTRDASVHVLQATLDQYPHRAHQVSIINHPVNKGVGCARKTALDAATGDAILYVDSDDYVAATAVQVLVGAMCAQDVDIVDGGYSIVTGGRVVRDFKPLHVNNMKYLKTILCQDVEPNRIWGRLIKRSLFTDNGISFTPGIDYSEDFSVLPRLLINAKRGWADDCIYYYRDDNPDSYTNNISIDNAISFLKAQQLVGEHMASTALWRDCRVAAELGWVNVWRFARRFNVDFRLVDGHFTLRPSCLATSCLAAIMRSHVPYPIANFIYKAARRAYLSMI